MNEQLVFSLLLTHVAEKIDFIFIFDECIFRKSVVCSDMTAESGSNGVPE